MNDKLLFFHTFFFHSRLYHNLIEILLNVDALLNSSITLQRLLGMMQVGRIAQWSQKSLEVL